MPLSPAFHRMFLMIGTPPFSTRSPSQASSAGSTVSEPTTATATTMIVPVANDVKVDAPPEVHARHGDHHRQARDEHRPPRGRRGSRQRRLFAAPRFALLALAAQVEHRVVDADRQADQQDHLVDRAVNGREVAGHSDQADRREDGRQREQKRNAGRDQRAECDQQDHERDRQRGYERPVEILADRIVQLLVDARIADLLDRETGIGSLCGGGGLQCRADPVRGLVLVAGDLEPKQRRMPVSRRSVRRSPGL